MNKQAYEKAVCEVIIFRTADILTVSDPYELPLIPVITPTSSN